MGKSRVGSLSQWSEVCCGARPLLAHLALCAPGYKGKGERSILSQRGGLFPSSEYLFSLLFCHLLDSVVYLSFSCREVMPGT